MTGRTSMARRWLRHLTTTHWTLRRCFPAATLAAIEKAIGDSEGSHGAEIRFVVETTLPAGHLLGRVGARERALEVFGHLGVWDTAANNGILLYVLLAERDIEIVADRGFVGLVRPDEWESICRSMEAAFREGRYEPGALAAIAAITALAARHFPPSGPNPDELPNRSVIL
jgi:uncharacterized membrane protein